MKAYMSNPDSGIRNLKPQLYATDKAFLSAESQHEARRILSQTERGLVFSSTTGAARSYNAASPWGALAEALAAFIAEPNQ